MNQKLFEKILIGLLLLGAFLSTLSPLWDPDSFWHLAFGRYIVENKSLPKTEPFAFLKEGQKITDLSWLPHLLFYLFYKYSGWQGSEILVSLIALITMIVLIRIVRSQNLTLLSLTFYFCLFFNAFGGRFKLRPEGISLLLFALLVYFLMNYRKEAVIFLPAYYFLFILWAQVHPSWIYGLVLIPFFILDKTKFKFAKEFFKDCFMLLFLPFVILFVNPYGYKLVLFPFSSFLTMKSDASFSIAEWQKSPWTLSTAPFISFVFLVVLFTLILFLKKKETFLPFAISLVQFIFLLSWVRYSSFAFIALTPFACFLFEWLLKKLNKFNKIFAAIAVLLSTVPLLSIATYQPTESLLEINYPEKEANFLLTNGISGNILHTFVAGGFIEFKTYPYCKSFMDGRYFDFENRIKEYEEARKDIAKFNLFSEKYPFEIVVMPYTKAKVREDSGLWRNAQAYLFPDERWSPVFYGPYGVVFLKRLPKYEKIIEKYEYKILFPDDNEYIKILIAGDLNKKEVLEKEIKRALETEAGF